MNDRFDPAANPQNSYRDTGEVFYTAGQEQLNRSTPAEDAPNQGAETLNTAGNNLKPVRKGPTWGQSIALVAAGMCLSSVITVGGVAAVNVAQTVFSSEKINPSISQSESLEKPNSGSATQQLANPNWRDVAAEIAPSTVSIEVRTDNGGGEGTGVIYQKDGTIITNYHVVKGARQIMVNLHDGSYYPARIVGEAQNADVAVIRLEHAPKDLKPASFADSSKVAVGESVMAVGSPLGLKNTVTTGIVSAVDRPVQSQPDVTDPNAAVLTSAIQTDASINPGNSGGPLVNTDGKVIGINSSISTIVDSQNRGGSIGLGFAIPSNQVVRIAKQLTAGQEATTTQMGVKASTDAQRVGEAVMRGARIQAVESGSPAASAGIKAGDLIIKIDEAPIASSVGLASYTRSLDPGTTHTVHLIRNSEATTLKLTV